MKRLTRPALGAAAALALVATPLAGFAADTDTTGAAPSSTNSTAGDVTLDLYTLTDVHGHIEKAVKKRDDGTEEVREAGLSAVSCYLNEARKTNPNSSFTLLGDNVGASPFLSGILLDNPTVAALNTMKPVASTIGNHELDLGQQAFKDRIDGKNGFTKVEFPYLGANIEGLGDDYLGDYEVWTSPSGIKVAFIGAIAQDVPTKLSPATTEGLTFNDPAPIINGLAKQLKDAGDADVVIAMLDDDVANNLQFMGPYVDGLMGGDTHVPYKFNDADGADGHKLAGVASGSYTDNLGNIRVVIDPATKTVKSVEAQLIPASELVKCGTVPEIDEIIAQAQEKSKIEGEKVVTTGVKQGFYRAVYAAPGEEPAPGSNRGHVSTLGELAADSLRETIKTNDNQPVDIGVINAGGLRTDLVPNENGEITYAQTFQVMPFSNEVGYVTITGKDFKDLLEQQWKVVGENSSRPMLKLGLSANVHYTFDPSRPMGDRVTSITVSGETIDPAASYTIASVGFMLEGGDSFPALTAGSKPIMREGLDRDYFNKYLAAHPGIEPRVLKHSTGITVTASSDGGSDGVPLTGSLKVDLQGLSLTTPEGQTSKVTVTMHAGSSSVSQSASVDNSIEEANASTSESVITVDGTGRASVSFSVADLCAALPAEPGQTVPFTVATDFGEAVPLTQGLGVKVNCSSDTDSAAPVDPSGSPAPVDPSVTPSGDGSKAPAASGGSSAPVMAKTGTNAGELAAAALVLLLMGGALTLASRYQASR